MAALPYIQLYVADYLADTMHLTTEEHGAYLLIIFNYWQTGKPIPKNRLARIARLSNDRWISVEASLSEFFNDNGTEWQHTRIDMDLEAVNGSLSQKSAAGKASAESRKRKKLTESQRDGNERSTTVENPLQQSVNENSTNKDTDTDTDKENKNTCTEPKVSLPAEKDLSPIFISMPTNKFNTQGEQRPITENKIAEWVKIYPAVDVHQTLLRIRSWVVNNPSKRKTYNGIFSFIDKWLAREQNSGGQHGKIQQRQSNANVQSGLAHDDTSWADELFGPVPGASNGTDQQDFQVIEGNFSRVGVGNQRP